MPSIIFVTDFDGTLTQKDTSYLALRSTVKYLNSNEMEKSEYRENWEHRGKCYYQNYSEKLKEGLKLFPCPEGHNKVFIEKFMKHIDAFNLDSRRELADSRIFDDFVGSNIEILKNEIIYQQNSKETLKAIKKEEQIKSKVLSVNWFPELLSTSLKGYVDQDDIVCAVLPTYTKNNCLVTTSELLYGQCASSRDKRQWIKKWFKDYECPIIYVGDSATDLLALLEATYGVIFGYNKQLREIAHHFKIELKPLREFRGSYENCEECTLYTTNSWHEIQMFVFQFIQ